jgi:hypothetical protein
MPQKDADNNPKTHPLPMLPPPITESLLFSQLVRLNLFNPSAALALSS